MTEGELVLSLVVKGIKGIFMDTFKKLKRLERKENRACILARVFGVLSIISLVGFLFFIILAFVFIQYFSKLIVLAPICGVVFMVLKYCESYFELEWLTYMEKSMECMCKELDGIEKDLKDFEDHRLSKEQELK